MLSMRFSQVSISDLVFSEFLFLELGQKMTRIHSVSASLRDIITVTKPFTKPFVADFQPKTSNQSLKYITRYHLEVLWDVQCSNLSVVKSSN